MLRSNWSEPNTSVYALPPAPLNDSRLERPLKQYSAVSVSPQTASCPRWIREEEGYERNSKSRRSDLKPCLMLNTHDVLSYDVVRKW